MKTALIIALIAIASVATVSMPPKFTVTQEVVR